jgi:hypothetical protein
MDLSQFEVTDSDLGVMRVRHPATGDELATEKGDAVTLTMIGMDSQRYREAQRKIIDVRLKNRSRAAALPSAGETEKAIVEGLAIAVVAWQNFGLGAEQTPCTTENVITAFDRLPWLRNQVDAFLGDRANFLKALPKV